MLNKVPDYEIKNNGKRIPIFKTPFTRSDYKFIISEESGIYNFGIHNQSTGEIKFYDIGNGHKPNFTSLFNVDMDFDFFKVSKYIGLGVVCFWAYRLSRAVPKNPLRTRKDTWDKINSMKSIFDMPNPNIVYNGDGKGFSEESE